MENSMLQIVAKNWLAVTDFVTNSATGFGTVCLFSDPKIKITFSDIKVKCVDVWIHF
jgi:hypothetical protein